MKLFAICLDSEIDEGDLDNAVANAANLSEMLLVVGEIDNAISVARKGADLIGANAAILRILAHALHQSGQAEKARAIFDEARAKATHAENLTALDDRSNANVCDFMLATGRAREVSEYTGDRLEDEAMPFLDMHAFTGTAYEELPQQLVAEHELCLGRAHATLALAETPPNTPHVQLAMDHLNSAIDNLRRAAHEPALVSGLLARASFRRVLGDFSEVSNDLAEVHEIASRGEMRLYLTDYYLESARLDLAQFAATADESFRVQAGTHCTEAAKLIADTGYNRRLREFDAIRACLHGDIAADILAPDRDKEGRPIWQDLATAF